jgi:hypothetical protein
MKNILRFGLGIAATAALGLAVDMYHGQLMDASCYNQNSSQPAEKIWVKCAPTASTTAFAIHTNGKVRMLDAAGNDKALTAFKEGILKRDPNGDMPVVVDGVRQGNTIKVEGIRARGSDTSVH